MPSEPDFGEGFESTIDRGDGGDVNSGVCVSTFLGGIEHSGILFGCCYWHDAVDVAQLSRERKDSPVSFYSRILFDYLSVISAGASEDEREG